MLRCVRVAVVVCASLFGTAGAEAEATGPAAGVQGPPVAQEPGLPVVEKRFDRYPPADPVAVDRRTAGREGWRPDGPRDRSRWRRSARRDWPDGGTLTYRGPRDATGGRWIYVRPARRGTGAYAGGYPYGGNRGRRWRSRDDAFGPPPLPVPRIEAPARYSGGDWDRYPYNIGRRRDF
jgi:hypothetical protein